MSDPETDILYRVDKALETQATTEISRCLSVCFDSTGRFALAGGGRLVRLWNIETGILIQTYSDHGHDVTSVVASALGDRLASSAGRTAYTWDIATSRCLNRFRLHDGAVNAVDFCATKDSLLVTGAYDKCVRIYDLKSRSSSPVQVLKGARDSVTDVCSVPGRPMIFAASVDGTVRSFDVRRGQVDVDDLCAPVSSLCVTNDKECLLCACMDGCLRLLDISTGELLATYEGHKNSSYKLECAVLFDDSVVVSGSEDGSGYCWKLDDAGSHPSQFVVSAGSPVSAVSAHPSKHRVLTGSHDGKLLVWSQRS